MKITKEMFDSLKQLDRIEYRQKADSIFERFNINIAWTACYILVFYIMGISVFLATVISQQAAIYFISGFADAASIWCSLFICFILVDFLLLGRKNSEIEKLNNKYFKIEVKNVKRKK